MTTIAELGSFLAWEAAAAAPVLPITDSPGQPDMTVLIEAARPRAIR